MIKPKIGLDWDDVTAPFNSIAIKMANEEIKFTPPLRLEEITSWENTGRTSVIKKYYSDKRLYERQHVSEETKSAIRKLMKIADVYFISAVYPDFMTVRANQILAEFPEMSQKNICLGAAKYLFHFDIVLDDNISNLLGDEENSISADFKVLMRKPWNTEMTGMLSVRNMDEFYVLVKQVVLKEKDSCPISKPRVIALVGPTGSGKNELADMLVSRRAFGRVVNYTTNKNAGKHIYIPEDAWKENIFFEETFYGGYRYGTKTDDVLNVLKRDKFVVIPVDMGGAITLKKNFPTTIIYVKKGRKELLSNILKKEMSDDEKVLRLLSLQTEMNNESICDFTVHNYEELNNLF